MFFERVEQKNLFVLQEEGQAGLVANLQLTEEEEEERRNERTKTSVTRRQLPSLKYASVRIFCVFSFQPSTKHDRWLAWKIFSFFLPIGCIENELELTAATKARISNLENGHSCCFVDGKTEKTIADNPQTRALVIFSKIGFGLVTERTPRTISAL